ncbi:MAG: CoA protein activase [Chloroflexi bacterium]|nr:CoA protein activase [Chloroflexota bacterium]
MKRVTFPHMGMIHVPMEVLFRQLGIAYVVPPPCTSRSLALAARYSPETVCIPYKLVLGNFLEALDLGANHLILLAGPNNCRFGYYAKLQEMVLQELGYECHMLTPQISSRTINGVTDILRYLTDYRASTWDCLRALFLAISVLRDLDEVERKMQWVRAREMEAGAAEALFQQAGEALAQVDSLGALKAAKKEFLKKLDAVPMERDRKPLRVSLVGEIYVVHEPYINMNIERELSRRRVEVFRSEQLSQWLVLSPALILEAAGLGHEARIAHAARPYLEHIHGETVGQTIVAERDGFHGVIQLTPFTCTPEVVNQNVLFRLRREHDIPLMTIILDEQTGRSGFLTRLEAFIDLLERRRGDTEVRPRRLSLPIFR